MNENKAPHFLRGFFFLGKDVESLSAFKRIWRKRKQHAQHGAWFHSQNWRNGLMRSIILSKHYVSKEIQSSWYIYFKRLL
jgi:hypothetical protein